MHRAQYTSYEENGENFQMCVCESGCVFITFDDSWQKRVTNKLQNVKEDDDGIGAHMRLPRETNCGYKRLSGFVNLPAA
jgi:hypothetical protein